MDAGQPAPPEGLRADSAELARQVRTQRTRLVWTALACAAVVAGVLAIEYRVMILTLFALLPVAIVYGDLRRLKKTAGDGFVDLRWSDDGLTIETAAGRVRGVPSDVAVRVTPRLLVVSRRLAQPNRFESWAIPAEPAPLRHAAQRLSSLGFSVTVERGSAATAVLLAGGVLLWRGLAVVAVGLVAGGLANIGLSLLGRGGSLLLGLLLLAGALLALSLAAIVRGFFPPTGPRP